MLYAGKKGGKETVAENNNNRPSVKDIEGCSWYTKGNSLAPLTFFSRC